MKRRREEKRSATAAKELGDPSHVLIAGCTPDTPKRDWAGVAIGLAGAVATASVAGSRLFGVGPPEPVSPGSVGAFLVLMALVATLAPALRAVRVDPVDAMRAE